MGGSTRHTPEAHRGGSRTAVPGVTAEAEAARAAAAAARAASAAAATAAAGTSGVAVPALAQRGTRLGEMRADESALQAPDDSREAAAASGWVGIASASSPSINR